MAALPPPEIERRDWSVEASDGHGKTWVRKFATADDYEPSDGRTILASGKRSRPPRSWRAAMLGAAHYPGRDRARLCGHSRRTGLTRQRHAAPASLPDDLANKPIGLATERDYARWSTACWPAASHRGTVRTHQVILRPRSSWPFGSTRRSPSIATLEDRARRRQRCPPAARRVLDRGGVQSPGGRRHEVDVRGSATYVCDALRNRQRDQSARARSQSAICRPITRTARDC